jgi:hypothetical protein
VVFGVNEAGLRIKRVGKTDATEQPLKACSKIYEKTGAYIKEYPPYLTRYRKNVTGCLLRF